MFQLHHAEFIGIVCFAYAGVLVCREVQSYSWGMSVALSQEG